MTGGRNTRVFVSYARADAARVAPIAEGLRSAGLEVLLDAEAIAKAEEWQPRLGKLITAADAVAFFLSPASAGSRVCGWEVETAERLGKRIVPVVLERVADHAAPPGLAKRNYIFADAAALTERAAGEIAEAVETNLTWVREHTRLTELAARWQESEQPRDQLLRGQEIAAAEAWLAAPPSSSNAPKLTPLLRTYIALSRKARARSRTVAASLGAAALALVLGGGLVVYEQQRAREAERVAAVRSAERAIAEEILRTVEKLDARLGFVLTAAGDGATPAGPPLSVPLPAGVLAETERIVAEQRVASLRQKLNGVPLNLDLRADMLRRAGLTKVDPSLIGLFYDALASVPDRTEDLLKMLAAAAGERCRLPIADRYHADRRALGVRAVRHDSNNALRLGLAVLWSLGVPAAEIDPRLARLMHLVPRAMPTSGPAHAPLLARDLQEQAAILAERGRLLEAAKAVNDACIRASADGLADDLALKPEDGPREIIVKAKMLRQLGEIEKSVAMFKALGTRFPEAFPRMAEYVAAAEAFTRSHRLPPAQDGGVYLDVVHAGGAAAAAGLEAGDIVLTYAGTSVSLVEHLLAAIKSATPGSGIEITYLRRGSDGRYAPRTLRLPAPDKLGVDMRPM